MPSRSCGYHATRNDALARDLPGLHVQVAPSLEQRKPISVTILFRSKDGDVQVTAQQFLLKAGANGVSYAPVDVKRTYYGPDKARPYHSLWFTVTFEPTSNELNEIALLLPGDSVLLGGQALALEPFRFRKVQREDIYYGSINC